MRTKTSDYIQLGRHRYCGELVDGLPDGFGCILWDDGCIYEGQWKLGKMHGRGRMCWPDQRRYNGEWLDNHIMGEGTMNYPDGSSFHGSFNDGRRHGHGISRDPLGQETECVYENDSLVSEKPILDVTRSESGAGCEQSGSSIPADTAGDAAGQADGADNPSAASSNVLANDPTSTIALPPQGFGQGVAGGNFFRLSKKDVIWRRTKTLLASLGFFALTALAVWLIVWLFDGGGGRVKIGLFLVPLYTGFLGVKYLIKFFINLFRPISQI